MLIKIAAEDNQYGKHSNSDQWAYRIYKCKNTELGVENLPSNTHIHTNELTIADECHSLPAPSLPKQTPTPSPYILTDRSLGGLMIVTRKGRRKKMKERRELKEAETGWFGSLSVDGMMKARCQGKDGWKGSVFSSFFGVLSITLVVWGPQLRRKDKYQHQIHLPCILIVFLRCYLDFLRVHHLQQEWPLAAQGEDEHTDKQAYPLRKLTSILIT